MSDSEQGTSSELRFIGRVKWFNNKSGYGFITASTGDMEGKDVFVHHSSIVVTNQQYKYLVQGEYVEFGLNQIADGKHQYQTSEVTGISKGKLMCETHREVRASRVKSKGSEENLEAVAGGKKRGPKVRGSGPRDDAFIAESKDGEIASSEEAIAEDA